MRSENRKQNGFSPWRCLKPISGSGFSCVLKFAWRAKTTLAFEHSAWLLQGVLASQGMDHDQTWSVYVLLSAESSRLGWRTVGSPCLEVSRGMWKPDPVLYQRSAIQNRGQFSGQKAVTYKWVRLQNPKRYLETQDHLRLSNSAARTLSWVEHTPSTFCGDPCPVRRGFMTAGICYVRKLTRH